MDFVLNGVSSPATGLPIAMTGQGNIQQTMFTLRHYLPRRYFVLCALEELRFQMRDDSYDGSHMLKDDILQVILQVLDQHSSDADVSGAAMACIENTSSVHYMGYIRKLANRVCSAMETFPSLYVVQHNGMRTIRDCILPFKGTYDIWRCAEVAIRCITGQAHYTPVKELAFAVLADIILKLSVEQRICLVGSNGIRELIDIIRRKAVGTLYVDGELESTVNLLGILTDESPLLSSIMVEDIDTLESFFVNSLDAEDTERRDSILVDLFGIFANLAEVKEIRPALLRESLITTARHLLTDPDQSMSLFAGYFLAQMLSCGPENWNNPDIVTHSTVAQELAGTVLQWTPSDRALCCIQSYRPYLILLRCPISAVQLCAIRIIHSLCSCCDNGQGYCSMLLKEGGHEIIKGLIDDPLTNVNVRFYVEMVDAILSGKEQHHGSAE